MYVHQKIFVNIYKHKIWLIMLETFKNFWSIFGDWEKATYSICDVEMLFV